MQLLAARLEQADLAALEALAAAERGRLALWLPVCAGAGIALYFAASVEPPWWAGGAVGAPALLGTLLGARPAWLRVVLALLAAGGIGFAAAQLAAARAAPPLELPRGAVGLSGIVRAVEILPEGRRITLEAARLGPDAPPLARTLRVRLRANDPAVLAPGEAVRVRALLRPPSWPAYPGAWDLQREAYFSGLGGGGTALGRVEVVGTAASGSVARRIQFLRDALAQRILAVVPGPPGAIAATLLTGESSALPQADRAAFAASGLAHLLAVAGLHIGIVMGLFYGAARFGLALSEHAALRFPCKQIAALAALGGGFGYLLLTGGHVPTLRSFAMACLVTFALLVGRRAVSLRGLALAAWVILLTDPVQLVGAGFQMSFSAVLALIAGYELARPGFSALRGDGGWRRRFAVYAAMLALTSFLAGTASAPFAAYHFGRLQIYYVLSNLVAVPITAFWAMPLGLLALALMPFGMAAPALVAMGWGTAAILWIARATAALPAASLAVPQGPLWGLLVLALGLAWVGLWRTPRLRLAGVPLIVAGLASPWLARGPDMLVSADAAVIALRTPIGMFTELRGGSQRFTVDAFAHAWGERTEIPFPPLGDDAEGMLDCSEQSCRIAGRAAAALLLRSETATGDCAGVAVLVSSTPAHGRCPEIARRVDRFTVWRDGAQAIWLDVPGARVVSDRAERGVRPWVPPPPAPVVHTDVDLPMAESE
jgi:competence protein ComEC